MSHCWEVVLIGQTFFYSGGLGANRNVSGKLGKKLAIPVVILQNNRIEQNIVFIAVEKLQQAAVRLPLDFA